MTTERYHHDLQTTVSGLQLVEPEPDLREVVRGQSCSSETSVSEREVGSPASRQDRVRVGNGDGTLLLVTRLFCMTGLPEAKATPMPEAQPRNSSVTVLRKQGI